MAVSLKKGQKVSLTKENAGLSNVLVGLGWDAAEPKKGLFFSRRPPDIDCDASAFLLTDGKIKSKEDIVYFGNLSHYSGAIQHLGDNLTGDGEGDDEQLVINLSKVPQQCDRIVIVVNIYEAEKRHQDFGMIKNAFIRIVDGKNNKELCRYNLSDDYSGMLACVFGEVYKQGSEWKFNAIGSGTTDPDIGTLAKRYV